MHTWLDAEVHLANQLITVRAVDRNVLEYNVISVNNFGTLKAVLAHSCRIFRISGTTVRVFVWLISCNHEALVLSLAKIGKDCIHFVNQSRVTCQVLYLLVRDN